MTIGMRTYERIKDAELKANSMGFKFKSAGYSNSGDQFVLITDKEKLPSYTPNTEMFKGNFEQLESFLHGIEWARRYDHVLGLKTGQRRTRVEQRIRNRQLIETIKNSDNGKEKDPPF